MPKMSPALKRATEEVQRLRNVVDKLQIEKTHLAEQRDDAVAIVEGAQQAAEIAQTELTELKRSLESKPKRMVLVRVEDERGKLEAQQVFALNGEGGEVAITVDAVGAINAAHYATKA